MKHIFTSTKSVQISLIILIRKRHFFLGVTYLLIGNLLESSKYNHVRSVTTSSILIPYTLCWTLFSSTKFFSLIW